MFLHEKFEKGHPRIDYAGAILVLAAASTIMFGLLEGGQSWAWVSWQSLSIFALAALLVIATVWVESRASAPVMPGWLWRIPALAGSNLAGAGMGLVMMAPNSYLPTFLQSVHAMGAIGAGFVLGCMSIGWPTASALSGRLYMRIGFRDSAVIGAGLMILGSVAFLLLPKPQPIWAVALDQVILGAGFGLISTPLLVGSQSVIGWNQRGVVTGAIMFSRNLGQSLGAALFGAVFNAAIANRLQTASHSLDEPMPSNVNSVIDVLHDANTPESVRAWLRDSIGIATDHLFWGMTALSVFVLLVLFIAPRQFPVHAEEQGKN